MPALPIEAMGSRATICEPKGICEGLVTTGWMWDDQVVERSAILLRNFIGFYHQVIPLRGMTVSSTFS
jgi:hypothetical protein